MPCWRFYGITNGVIVVQHFACGQNAYYAKAEYPNSQWNPHNLFVDGVMQNGWNYQYWKGGPYSFGLEQVLEIIPTQGISTTGDCNVCTGLTFDCINGSCVNKTQYGTPGIYNSISACEQNCGPGCGGVCISNAEWSEISSLASQVKNKVCS
ncbi:MAG: hypothetical protein ACKPJO_19040 [Dolichospermum sp.]